MTSVLTLKNDSHDSVITDDRLLTEKQVEHLTGRACSTLQKDRVQRRGIPFVKVGRSVRYYFRDVKAFLHENRVEVD